jgi:hypothetical protein
LEGEAATCVRAAADEDAERTMQAQIPTHGLHSRSIAPPSLAYKWAIDPFERVRGQRKVSPPINAEAAQDRLAAAATLATGYVS